MSATPPPSYTAFRRIGAGALGIVFLFLVGAQLMSYVL